MRGADPGVLASSSHHDATPLALLLAALAAAGPVYQGTERNLRVDIPRLDATVTVDGRLSEPVWAASGAVDRLFAVRAR